MVLAVITPAVEPAEHAAEAASSAPPAPPAVAQAPDFAFNAVFAERPSAHLRSSRSAIRRAVAPRPALRKLKKAIRRAVKSDPVRRETRSVLRRRVHLAQRGTVSRVVRTFGAPRGMRAVLAFARTQVGKGYVSGGEGPSGYDCSGFTKRAYARAGLRLPHSSGAQAARARSISRARARPGDLVVGTGHVGIYMGGGMMIDAGNRRTGVVYRPLFGGLHIERF
jgi:cell wall-associated NlpC family hydrolase